MQFKKTRKALPEIGRQLKVDAVVEGSVLHAGNRVRITAQLIEAAPDRHLWAETYERDLADVLALQGEVARAIADQIRVRLTPGEHVRLAKGSPVKPEAYEYHLRGKTSWMVQGRDRHCHRHAGTSGGSRSRLRRRLCGPRQVD